MILKLRKKITTIKVLIFLKDVDIEILRYWDKSISSGEKDHTNLIGYFYYDHKFKPLHTMLPKTNAYEKSYDGQN